MASLPYPLCHDCPTGLVGMAWMPYPPTICKDNSELLLNDIGIMNFSINGKADFWDVFGLSLGLKAQLL